MTPLDVPEARAILLADDALEATFEARQELGLLIGLEEGDAWRRLVASANDRIKGWGRSEAHTPQTLSVLACREGASWVVQALEEDVASQGDSLLGALADLGRMFDARDQIVSGSAETIAPNPPAPVEYAQAFGNGHYVGILRLGAVRAAQVYIGISPFEKRLLP